jgi:GMC oxidoreductase
VKLGIAAVITDEGIRPEVLVKALGNRGFDSIHVTENSHIPASRTTPYQARGEFYWSYDALVALTAAALARGVERLRVADASVMPTIIRGHTHAPSVLIGEKAADLILS